MKSSLLDTWHQLRDSELTLLKFVPPPSDKLGVQRLLVLAQYLVKFLPNLSDITKPLRDITQNDVQFVLQDVQKKAFKKLLP